MSQHEHTLNIRIGDALRGMRRRWQVHAESLGAAASSSRPDILITEAGAAPLVIEHETMPAQNVEDEAKSRLGLSLASHRHRIQASIALRSPAALRKLDETRLAAALRADDPEIRFEYALFRGRIPRDAERWPERGWLRGRLPDLALLAQQAMRPSEEIDKLAGILERDIELARRVFSEAYPPGHRAIAALFAAHLRLEDDPQTRRMAMAILANALIFQQSLAGHEEYGAVRTPEQLYSRQQLHKTEILQDWDAILRINYYPIFHVARELLRGIDDIQTAQAILNQLFHIIQEIVLRGAARSHDLAGFVFQRLIADRKFLATFYTRPESAALLAALALRDDGDWGDAEKLKRLRVADFACGTGTLLSAVYARLAALHELAGGDMRALHRDMIEQVLVGCDVLPMATHLSLSMLAAAYPEQTFRMTNIITTPYGAQNEGESSSGELGDIETIRYRLGALDLLELESVTSTLPTQLALMQDHGIAVGGTGEVAANIPHGGYDLVIMNPPFTRPNIREGEGRAGVPNPAFAALGTSDEDQRTMGRLLSSYRDEIPYHGNAGLASAFLGLADKKLKPGGTLAMVLPLVISSGTSWEQARQMLRQKYTDIYVATIAGAKSVDKAFSADTGLGECLLVARKNASDNKRARFLTLRERPRNAQDGLETAKVVHSASHQRHLEDGPFGGTPIQVGEDEIGQTLEFSLPENGPWQLAGILDFSLAQSAYQIANGQIWLPTMRVDKTLQLHMVETGKLLATKPVYSFDINSNHRSNKAGVPRGPFDIHRPPLHPEPTFPTLWAHDAPNERCMELQPDSEAIVKSSFDTNIQTQINDKAARIWLSATCAHHNSELRFNSQALAVSITTRPSLGGRAWPSIIFPVNFREKWEIAHAVWSNSTLGILCYWWVCSRQDSGRGSISVTALPALPTLDLRRLSPAQLAAAARIFADHKNLPMLPINQIDEDENRAELDRRLLTEVLGLPAELCTGADSPLALLRRKLAAEPSIHGGKKSKVVL